MKLRVLGSGGVSAFYRSPAYLIDESILVDIPNGSWKLIRTLDYDYSKIENIIITHYHADHFFDLPFAFLTKVESSLNVYGGPSSDEKIKAVIHLAYPDIADKILAKTNYKIVDSDEFTVGPYKGKRFKVIHGDCPEAYAYTLDDGKIKVGFSGDSMNCPNLEEAIKGCNHFICECSMVEGNEKHMGISELFAFADKYKDCTFYATHLTDKSRAALEQGHPDNVVILHDMDEFEF